MKSAKWFVNCKSIAAMECREVEFEVENCHRRAKIEESIAMCTISRAKLREERIGGGEGERRKGRRRGGGKRVAEGGESLIYLRLRVSVSRQSVVIRARRCRGVCGVPLNFRVDTRSIHL